MNCSLPILTDSGGFQVMSLSKLNKIDKEIGAIFNSHIDGKKFILSPEESIKIQLGLNSDIVMVMDECPKKTDDYDANKRNQWIFQCIGPKDQRNNLDQTLIKHFLELFRVDYLMI